MYICVTFWAKNKSMIVYNDKKFFFLHYIRVEMVRLSHKHIVKWYAWISILNNDLVHRLRISPSYLCLRYHTHVSPPYRQFLYIVEYPKTLYPAKGHIHFFRILEQDELFNVTIHQCNILKSNSLKNVWMFPSRTNSHPPGWLEWWHLNDECSRDFGMTYY